MCPLSEGTAPATTFLNNWAFIVATRAQSAADLIGHADWLELRYPRAVFHARVSRLFHGIVVVGSALGCSGRSTRAGEPESDANSAAHELGAAARPRDCDHPEQFVCQDFELFYLCVTGGTGCNAKEVDNCRCDPERPVAASSCAAPEQFSCEVSSFDGHPLGCRCDVTAPVDPSDCAAPQQFHCASLEPRMGCACDATAPLEASDCDPGQRLECQSYEPALGCQCIRTIILR